MPAIVAYGIGALAAGISGTLQSALEEPHAISDDLALTPGAKEGTADADYAK